MKKIWLYVAISALVLAAGGILLLTQSGCSGSMEIGQGPTMLYFYAKW